eukprot:2966903-Pleurochrysis_carterae.AAC.1
MRAPRRGRMGARARACVPECACGVAHAIASAEKKAKMKERTGDSSSGEDETSTRTVSNRQVGVGSAAPRTSTWMGRKNYTNKICRCAWPKSKHMARRIETFFAARAV